MSAAAVGGAGSVGALAAGMADLSLAGKHKGELAVAGEVKVALPPGMPAEAPYKTWKDMFMDEKKKVPLLAYLEGTLGWTAPSPVQSAALPYLLDSARFSMRVQSETGTGKTGAFAVTMLGHVNPDKKEPQAIVLVPTKELVVMHTERLKPMVASIGVDVVGVMGGKDVSDPTEPITAQIVVGTIGKVVRLIEKRIIYGKGRPLILSPASVNTLVIDEADELLSSSPAEIATLHKACTAAAAKQAAPLNKLQTLLFSATYDLDEDRKHSHSHSHHRGGGGAGGGDSRGTISSVAGDATAFITQLLGPPPSAGDAASMDFLAPKGGAGGSAGAAGAGGDKRLRVDVVVAPIPKKVTHILATVPRDVIAAHGGDATAAKVSSFASIFAATGVKALVFSNSGREVHTLPAHFAKAEGSLPCAAVASTGEDGAVVDMKARIGIFNKMDRGEIRLLATTDLYSRGVDVKDLRIVANLQPPRSKEVYHHRSGRVGRLVSDGGKTKMTVGVVVDLVENEGEAGAFEEMALKLGRKPVRITLSAADKDKNIDLLNDALAEPLEAPSS